MKGNPHSPLNVNYFFTVHNYVEGKIFRNWMKNRAHVFQTVSGFFLLHWNQVNFQIPGLKLDAFFLWFDELHSNVDRNLLILSIMLHTHMYISREFSREQYNRVYNRVQVLIFIKFGWHYVILLFRLRPFVCTYIVLRDTYGKCIALKMRYHQWLMSIRNIQSSAVTFQYFTIKGHEKMDYFSLRQGGFIDRIIFRISWLIFHKKLFAW